METGNGGKRKVKNTAKLRWVLEEKNERQQRNGKQIWIAIENGSPEYQRYLLNSSQLRGWACNVLHYKSSYFHAALCPPLFNRLFLWHSFIYPLHI